jgi:Zn-dependent protease with chaperone function
MAARSLAGRALVAVALMLGFYLLAIGIAAGLFWIPWAEWHYAGRIHLKILLGCGIGGLLILYSLLPRRDAFEPPGPRLEPQAHPALFAALEGVASKVGQSMPREVYLVPELNAWVANRGGVMGFGSQRVMGIGLPLLQVVDVPSFEAILAHEFGHYHGGDTRLGPWIYKTRIAIGRTLETLGSGSWLQLPFRWYGNLFLRITQAISRAQELTADRLAAAVVGARELARGLRAVHAYAGAFDAYWRGEAVPVLRSGFHAPLAAGFAEFLRVPRVEGMVREELASALSVGKSLSFDSHPPLQERIAALGDPGREAEPSSDAPRALSLLGDVAALEGELLRFLGGKEARFAPVAWKDVPDRVFLPAWRRQRQELRAAFGEVSWARLPAALRRSGAELARRAHGLEGAVPEGQVARALSGPIGACVAVALVERGWSLAAGLGDPVTLGKDGGRIEPFAVAAKLLEDPAAEARFVALVEAEGIGAQPVAP